MSVHSWCRDVQRDEAVRAAEDGRIGPLPTLLEAIDAVWMHTRNVAPAANGDGRSNHGLRTERVTLEVTHDLDAPLGRWLVGVIDESLGLLESVRVVEESAPPARGWLTEEEREAVQCVLPFADDPEQAKTLTMLLARSSPPEVVLPVCEFTSLGNYEMGFLEAIGRVKRALAAAGVKVKEVGK